MDERVQMSLIASCKATGGPIQLSPYALSTLVVDLYPDDPFTFGFIEYLEEETVIKLVQFLDAQPGVHIEGQISIMWGIQPDDPFVRPKYWRGFLTREKHAELDARKKAREDGSK
jgi:hypothetical protein